MTPLLCRSDAGEALLGLQDDDLASRRRERMGGRHSDDSTADDGDVTHKALRQAVRTADGASSDSFAMARKGGRRRYAGSPPCQNRSSHTWSTMNM
jgi:hypothetical protein